MNFLNRYRKSQSTRPAPALPVSSAPRQTPSSLLPKLRTNALHVPEGANATQRQTRFSLDPARAIAQSASNRNMKPSPPSPSLETRLSSFVEQCKVTIIPGDSKSILLRSKKADILTKIFCLVSNTDSIRSVSRKCRTELFGMLSETVNREIPQIPLVVIYSDEKVKPQTSENWMFLSIAHKIIQQMIINCDFDEISELLTKEFLVRYIALLEDQVVQEQALVENTVLTIYNSMPTMRITLFNLLLNQIRKYKDNPYIFPCVASTLRIITQFLKDIPRPFKPSYVKLFKEFIFPLISTQMSSEFFPQINRIGDMYYSDNENLTIWAVAYMHKYWPKTDTRKICAFINHIPVIAVHLTTQNTYPCGLLIFQFLAAALKSYNFQVSISALTVIKTTGFISTFGNYLDELIPILLAGINACSKHWNQTVVKTSFEVARIIIAINPQSSTPEVIVQKEKQQKDYEITTKEKWLVIEKLAREVSKDNSLSLKYP